MIEYTIKILGAQYAANPDYKFGDPETPEMWARTIGLLSDLRDMRPRVVLKLEPTNPNDPLAVMARAMGNKIGYVCKGQRDKVRTIISQSKRGMLAADISEVVVAKHGYLYITLKCPETVDDSTKEPGFDWSEWQKSAPQIEEQILAKQKEQQARQEQKQDKMIEEVEKAANKPTTQNIMNLELVNKKETNIDKNYGPNIEQNGGTLTLPDNNKE